MRWGLWRSCWWGRDPAMERESQSPCHIPLKSKCRGTSPGRSGSVAQRLGRQAVTALGHGPARLAGPLLTSAHPVWPGLTGVRQPTPSGQAGALHYGVPPQSLCWDGNSGSIHRGGGSRGGRQVGGDFRSLAAPPAPRPLDGGPVESAADDNPHLTARPFCLQGLHRSTHPHGNSGRAVHTM